MVQVGSGFHPIMDLVSCGVQQADVTKLSQAGFCTVESVCEMCFVFV